eukprot:Skav233958  [mRNA]  locus=scaffold1382:274230:287634:- [translate_table: standard]
MDPTEAAGTLVRGKVTCVKGAVAIGTAPGATRGAPSVASEGEKTEKFPIVVVVPMCVTLPVLRAGPCSGTAIDLYVVTGAALPTFNWPLRVAMDRTITERLAPGRERSCLSSDVVSSRLSSSESSRVAAMMRSSAGSLDFRKASTSLVRSAI